MLFLYVTSRLAQSALFSLTQLRSVSGKNRLAAEQRIELWRSS